MGEINYLLGKDRKKIIVLVLFFLVLTLLDLAGLGLITPYISIILNEEMNFVDNVNLFSQGYGLIFDFQRMIISLSILMIVVFFTKSMFGLWINYKIISFSMNQQVRLTSYLMKSYQYMPYTTYLLRNSSEYIYSIQVLTGVFSGKVITNILQAMSNGIVSIFILIMLAWSNVEIFSFIIVLITGIIYGFDQIFRNRLNNYGKLMNYYSTKVVQGINESISGFKEIIIFGKRLFFYDLVMDRAKKNSEIGIKNQVITLSPRYLLELLIVTLIVLTVLANFLSGNDLEKIIPTLGLFGLASLRLIPSANSISKSLLQLRFSRDGVSKLYNEIVRLEKIQKNQSDIYPSETQVFKKLTLSNINFFYPESKYAALVDVSLQLNSGESIGIIGSSGAGKTSLVDLILGLLQPQSGIIKYNNIELKKVLTYWRSQIAYLPQQVFLIDNTIRKNIALGELESDINNERILEALKMASLSDLINQLHEGINTVIGEHGAKLSGGQRQRIALARAFYHRRTILVLDEATSALDNDTEAFIVSEIQRLKRLKTMIVIAHRLSTVKHCDRIYRLESGKIVEEGTPEKVLQ